MGGTIIRHVRCADDGLPFIDRSTAASSSLYTQPRLMFYFMSKEASSDAVYGLSFVKL